MKKLFSLLTVLLCAVVLSSTAFASDADAYTIYKNYVKKSNSVSSMELSIVQKLSMVTGDESLELTKQNASAKMLITPDNKLQMEMKLTDSATEEVAYAYFKDNYLYEKIGDEKFKIKMDMDDAMSSTANIDLNLTLDDLRDAKVEKVDGGVKITYKTKLDEMDNSVTSALKDIGLPNDIKMTFTSVTTSMTIGDDGMLKSCANAYGVTLSDGQDTIKLKITQNVKVKAINTVEKINFPSDLNTYKTLAQ